MLSSHKQLFVSPGVASALLTINYVQNTNFLFFLTREKKRKIQAPSKMDKNPVFLSNLIPMLKVFVKDVKAVPGVFTASVLPVPL